VPRPPRGASDDEPGQSRNDDSARRGRSKRLTQNLSALAKKSREIRRTTRAECATGDQKSQKGGVSFRGKRRGSGEGLP